MADIRIVNYRGVPIVLKDEQDMISGLKEVVDETYIVDHYLDVHMDWYDQEFCTAIVSGRR